MRAAAGGSRGRHGGKEAQGSAAHAQRAAGGSAALSAGNTAPPESGGKSQSASAGDSERAKAKCFQGSARDNSQHAGVCGTHSATGGGHSAASGHTQFSGWGGG